MYGAWGWCFGSCLPAACFLIAVLPRPRFQAVLRGAAPPLSVAAADVPGAFVEVAARALERDPQRRYSTAREFRDAVDAAALQQGPALTRDELHGWLSGLFPEGQTNHARLLERARARGLTFRRGLWLHPKRLLRFGGGVALLVMGVAVGAAGAVRWRASDAATSEPADTSLDGRVMTQGSPAEPRVALPPETIEIEEVAVAEATPPEPAVNPSAPEVRPDDVGQEGSTPALPPDESAGNPSTGETEAAAGTPTMRESPQTRRRRPPARRATTMQRAEGARGTLLLVARGGWGRVFLRGRPLGETPLRATLPVGRHRLEVRLSSGERRPVAVRIRPGRATRVSIDAR